MSVLMIICLNGVFANHDSKKDPKEKAKSESNALTGIEGWLQGQVLNGNTLVSYFIISQGEFLEYINTNQIFKISIEYFSEDKNGSDVQLLKTIVLEDFSAGFNVETWAGEVENADTSFYNYLAQVTLNDDFCGPKTVVEFIQEEIEEEEEVLPIELPEYECGESFTPETISNQTPLASASSGSIFIIGGFPILVQTVSGSNGIFSGTGIVPLPFDKKVVQVEFNGISVNDQYQVYQGVVNAVAGDPANYPNFQVEYDPYNIGGEICQPPPPPPGYNSEGVNGVTGLDDWGFDPTTGLNSQTQTPFDQNGFDINGNHADTGTPYNNEGCNREGFTETGAPCDPSGGPNPEAQAFADSIAATLGVDITDVLSALSAQIQDSLVSLNCNGIRTEMEGLLNTLGYARSFIFGVNDIYFNKNMHLAFQQKPKPLVLNIQRDDNAEALENKHIDLYECDRQEYALDTFLIILGTMSTDPDLLDVILDKINNWTNYEYGLYADDPVEFNNWLIITIGDIMKAESGLDDSYTYQDAEGKNFEHQKSDQFQFNSPSTNQWYNSIASNDGSHFFNEAFTLEDASFFFRQGDQKINNVDRVFYLEALARQRRFFINNEPENLLPITVEKTVGNKTYSIYLDNISITPTGAVLDAYAIIDDPESGRRLSFKALNVSFGPTGLQEESKLHLASDIEIRLNNTAMLILKGTEETYVSWDCEGFSGMGIDADIEFCRNYIIPLDPITLDPKPDPERFKLSIAVQDISSWLEFYIVVDAPPFAIAEYEDVKWELTNMVLDFSSSETPTFKPLEGYASPFYDGTNMSPAWKGFYMEQLSATLPDDLSNGQEPTRADAVDILIDGSGFTGGVAVENLITIDEGNLGGWPFSINEFEIRVIKNQFAGAGFAGEVNVPIFKENMEYQAVMYPGSEYSFTVSPLEDAKVDMFLANAEIYSDSQIKIGKVGGEFLAVATLNGKMHVSTSNDPDGTININLPSLCFQGFEVSNKSPYFSPGNWGLTDTGNAGVSVDFNGFGVRVDNLQPYNPGEGKAGLGLNLDINLVDALGINAGGQLGIEGELVEENGRQRWKFDRVDIGSLYVDASFQGAAIKGLVEWYGSETQPDPEWGKGFRGLLSAKFKGFDVALDAAAQFGRKDDYKYFFVDALADLGAGIGAGAIQLKGFGGGVSWNMDADHDQVSLMNQNSNNNLPPIGTSFSGASYTPAADGGLGLKASVIIATMKDEVFNGTVSLIMDFNGNNGLEEMTLQGSGQFLTPVNLGIAPNFTAGATSPPSSVDASLSAFINLTFNFEEPSFHGDLNVFLNAGLIRGVGDGGKLVDAELHFDANQWYIYIGRPEEGKRCGMIVQLPGIGQVQATAYFDVGTNVPPMGDLPDKVKEIAYLVNDNQSLRNSGAGFVMGASIGFKMSAKIAGIISSTLEAEAGYDLMLRKYEGLTCQGSNEPVGIDGWYASGQMWAYVHGQLKVFGVNIVSAGLAAVLQARLPNPFFAQATVGVKIKVLFGTVKKSLKVKLGDDCILVSNNPQDELGLEVITFLEPIEGVTDVEPNASIKATFALELDNPYQITDLQGVEQEYKVELLSTSLTNSNGFSIAHTVEYLNDKTSIQLIPLEMLPSNDSIHFEVTVKVFKNGAFLTNETKETYFFTGDALDYIPESNIVSSYPAAGMTNFYKREYNAHEGFINLNIGQPDLLLPSNFPAGKEQKVRITASNGFTFKYAYDYDVLEKRITFALPPSLLNNGEIYKLEIIRIDANTGGGAASATPTSTLGLALKGNEGYTPNGPSTGEESTTSTGIETEEEILWSTFFRVSDYDSFSDKMDAIMSQPTQVEYENRLYVNTNDYEALDYLEYKGDSKYDPLVKFTAEVNVPWINNTINPIFEVFEPVVCNLGYELDPENLKNSVGVAGSNGNLKVTADNFSSGQVNLGTTQRLTHNLGASALDIFVKMKFAYIECLGTDLNQFLYCESIHQNGGSGNPNSGGNPNGAPCYYFTEIINAMHTKPNTIPLANGTYPVNAVYRLPNGQITTSKIINFIK
ncbi:MAG: hypothetical protein AAF573_06065 [Bacteroidota bacterium]